MADISPAIFYQLAGWLAVCFYVGSFQSLDPRRTIFLWIPANAMMAVHYFGLVSFTACALASGAIVRDLTIVYGPQRLLKTIVVIFIFYIWAAAALLSSHVYDLLITFGTMFTATAAFYRDQFWKQRLFAFLQQAILFCGFWLLGSYPAMAFVTLTFCSNMLGVVRKRRTAREKTFSTF